ncbi:glycosyltransferase family 2 protein [Candidatus Kryptobacter tengchongensis]|uniref:glycosyltransferase family 2 protein n=1 Tax=Kryptobacter tengchongensis TaxID=1643429 RepID=UPI00070749C0|nr:glycosyltransferase family 2 protein [Candidatus Kryptobacter tengchongensis]CUS78026.1 rhamnosyltransferase [Candidatus Kryptobacter tengchongensis]
MKKDIKITKFDVIILTYNSQNRILNLINSIKLQTIQPENILVIDSNSTDDTVKIAKNNGCITYVIKKEDFDHGGTRTYAAKLSNAEFLVYLTDDVLLYDKYSLENLLVFFDDNKVAAVFGRQIPYEDTNIWGKHLRFFNYPENDYIRSYQDKKEYGIKTVFLSNSFCAYRKEALEKVGYFKEKLILGEDTYIGAKLIMAGYKIAYSSKAIVFHSHSYSIIQEFKRYVDIGIFHRTENWILKEFGAPKREGKKYIFSGIKYLVKNKKVILIPEFFIRVFFKYLGYKLGYNYTILPKFLVKIISMHKPKFLFN